MGHTTDIGLADARALIARAIDKAEDIGMRGAIAVMGASGALVSASRMDHGGAGGMARARSKAWIAATQQIPSAAHLSRMQMVPAPMTVGFSVCSPEAVFPGAGGMPIRADGGRAGEGRRDEGRAGRNRADGHPNGPVIAGIAASGAGIGPFVDYPGAEPQKLIADGRPANGEDLLVHYALGVRYEGQHGDDLERWRKAYGEFSAGGGAGLGMADPPGAAHQPEHDWALQVADRALAEAARRGERISVAVVDSRGDPIQQDRMDGAPTASVNVAEALAATSATFQCPSYVVGERYAAEGLLAQLQGTLPYSILAAPGGLPIAEDGRVVAGVGIGGPAPHVCGLIAAAVINSTGAP